MDQSGYNKNVKGETMTPEKRQPRQLLAADQVLQMVTDYCQALRPGDPVPPHQELMRLFDASERSVRGALDELRRQGKIVRRRGARTFVADLSQEPNPSSHSGELRAKEYVDGSRNGFNGDNRLDISAAEPAVRSATVVVILEPDGSFFDLALQSLMRQAKSDKLSVECRLLAGSEADGFEIPAVSKDGPLGYVLFRKNFAVLAERLQSAGHRVVLMGFQHPEDRREVPTIYSSHKHGSYLAMRHLIALGHRHVLAYHHSDGMAESVAEAHEAGILVQFQDLPEVEVEQWARDPESARRFFNQPAAPTAVVTWNDVDAIKLINLLHRAGLNVPEDVSVVGYDNLPQGRDLYPALTSIDPAVDLQVSLALRLLLQGDLVQPGQTICIEPTLVARDSSAPPRTISKP